MPSGTLPPRAEVSAFADIGVTAFTTTRAAGDFALGDAGDRPEGLARWRQLLDELNQHADALKNAKQVHGTVIVEHAEHQPGWHRIDGADGHYAKLPRTALAS